MANATPHSGEAYDKEVRKTIPFYDCFLQETLDLVKACQPECSTWLDTGAGTGSLVEAALPRFPKTQFFLADPSEEMLREARAKLGHHSQCRILPAGSSGQLPALADLPALDVVTAIQCHHYSGPEGRQAAVQACHQILKPGGLFVTFENIRPLSEQGITIGLDRWITFQRLQGRSESVCEDHRQRFGKKYFPITVPEHLALMSALEFRVVELFWYSRMQAGFYALK
jgi:tRNA (cmo5U34)-methyltransferase